LFAAGISVKADRIGEILDDVVGAVYARGSHYAMFRLS
jgi:hypothetical protein